MHNKPTIAIIGASFQGLMSAYLHACYGFDVFLLEKKSDIMLGGSPPPVNIGHLDGLEYLTKLNKSLTYKDYDPRIRENLNPATGYSCVGGGMLLPWFYGSQIKTKICHKGSRPIFSLANGALARVSVAEFRENIELMREKYASLRDYGMGALGLSEEEANTVWNGTPEEFIYELEPGANGRVDDVACSVAGSACGLDMQQVYWFWKARLREMADSITFMPSCNTNRIQSLSNGNNRVYFNNSAHYIDVKYVQISCGTGIPYVVNRVDKRASGPDFYCMMNGMATIDVPPVPLGAMQLMRDIQGIYFTTPGAPDGSSFVCKDPPGFGHRGTAVSYAPNKDGSQIFEHKFDLMKGSQEPRFENYLSIPKYKLPDERSRKIEVLSRLHQFYPCTRDYLRLEHITGFHIGAVITEHEKGEGRSQRELMPPIDITPKQDVSVHYTGKFTTVVANGLAALDHSLKLERGTGLPTRTDGNGIGYEGANYDAFAALEPAMKMRGIDRKSVVADSRSFQQTCDIIDDLEFSHSSHSSRAQSSRMSGARAR